MSQRLGEAVKRKLPFLSKIYLSSVIQIHTDIGGVAGSLVDRLCRSLTIFNSTFGCGWKSIRVW